MHVLVLVCIHLPPIPESAPAPALTTCPAPARPSVLTDDVELGPALQVLLALAADGHQLDLHAQLSQLAEAPLGLQTGELQGEQACQLFGLLWIGTLLRSGNQLSEGFKPEQWLQVAGITTPALP